MKGVVILFQVETFQHPKKFYNSLVFENNVLHITAVTSLSVFLRKKFKDHSRNISTYVDTFDNLQTLLFPNWYSSFTEIYLTSRVRALLNREEQTNIVKRMLNNIPKCIKTLSYLVELNAPVLVETGELTEEQRVFTRIYQHLKKESVVQDYLSTRQRLTKENIAQKCKLPQVNKIYIYQLNQFDPSRMFFLHLCRALGIDIVFRIPFQREYSKLYNGWEVLYEELTKIPSTAWRTVEDDNSLSGLKLALYIEGRHNEQAVDHAEFTAYYFEHPADLKRYLHMNPQRTGEHRVVAPRYQELNQSMRDVLNWQFPEKQEHLGSSPLGKFLLFLFQCRRTDEEIHLSYETFVEFITSGWIYSGDVSGLHSLTLLTDLEPYMNGIETLQDIKTRIEALIEFNEMGRSFDELAKDQAGRHRIKRYLTNPFRAFPFIHQHRYDVTPKQLSELTIVLERKLRKLLPKEEESVYVAHYIKALHDEVAGLHAFFPKQSVQELQQRLLLQNDPKWSFTKEELADMVSVLLSRKGIMEEEDSEQQYFSGLEQLDGLVLDTEHIHVTDLSFKQFPKRREELSSSTHLNYSWVKHSINHSFEGSMANVLLHCLAMDYYSQDRSLAISIYNLYYALAFSNKLTISWIKGLDEYDDQSIYLNILQHLHHDHKSLPRWQEEEEIVKYDFWNESQDEGQIDPYSSSAIEAQETIDLHHLVGEFPISSWLDYDFCARKFYFTSILQNHPIYETDFHQRLLFGTLGKLFSQIGEGRRDVEEFIYPLFPQWTNTLKTNLIDTEYYRELRQYRSFQNVSYPEVQGRLQRLRSQYIVGKRYKVKNSYREDKYKDKEWLKEFKEHITPTNVQAEPGEYCKMCPHLMICKEGEYAIDNT
jgi:hypothetical protein